MSSKDSKKQTYFGKAWLEHENFSQWVAEFKKKLTKHSCKICHKTNGVSNKGIGTLKIHLKGPKHSCKICHKTNGVSNKGIGALKIHLKGPSHEVNAKKIKNLF